LLERIARTEACLAEFISGNLGASTEFLDADRADGKLPSCDEGGQVKEVPSGKADPVWDPKDPASLVKLPAGNLNKLNSSEVRFVGVVIKVRTWTHGEGMYQEGGNVFHVTHGFPVGPLAHHDKMAGGNLGKQVEDIRPVPFPEDNSGPDKYQGTGRVLAGPTPKDLLGLKLARAVVVERASLERLVRDACVQPVKGHIRHGQELRLNDEGRDHILILRFIAYGFFI